MKIFSSREGQWNNFHFQHFMSSLLMIESSCAPWCFKMLTLFILILVLFNIHNQKLNHTILLKHKLHNADVAQKIYFCTRNEACQDEILYGKHLYSLKQHSKQHFNFVTINRKFLQLHSFITLFDWSCWPWWWSWDQSLLEHHQLLEQASQVQNPNNKVLLYKHL